MRLRASGAALLLACAASSARAAPPSQDISFSVGPDQSLLYPTTSLTILPDEHTTILPQGPNSYLMFAADGGGAHLVVLQTTNLTTFNFAVGYSTDPMGALEPFTTCSSGTWVTFDANYAAPGSVLQDPTMPPGNLMMFYEAENHCPGGVHQQPFYVTVGFARSSDNGVTWPAPVNAEFGGPTRYPVLKVPDPEPLVAESTPTPWGDYNPSAYVDGNYVYVTYGYAAGPPGGSDPPSDGMMRVARAPLGGSSLTFSKWYEGSFSQPGIGGLDSSPLPSKGCSPGYQLMSEISHNDALGLYFFIFVCNSTKLVSGVETAYQAAWYFSTATSLELEDWTAPQMIEGSEYPESSCGVGSSGNSFDGFYPSFMSPGMPPGHLSTTGEVFFTNGCDTAGSRPMLSRTFTIGAQSNDVGLVQVYPNPFRPSQGDTVVTFQNLPANAKLRIYTLAGERVKGMTANAAGIAVWDVRNDSGQQVASGVYYVLAESGGNNHVFKVAVQR